MTLDATLALSLSDLAAARARGDAAEVARLSRYVRRLEFEVAIWSDDARLMSGAVHWREVTR